MATHDYSIANQSFPATRSDLNNALTAIKSSNSDSTAPSTSLVAGQLFYDTANTTLKVYDGSSFSRVGIDTTAALALTNSTSATSATTGALKVTGGISTQENLWAGGTTTSTGLLTCAKSSGTGLSVTSNASITGTLSAAATTLSSTLAVSGATTLSSTLAVTGATTLSSTLAVTTSTTTPSVGLDSTDYISWTNNTQTDFYINGNNKFRMEADGDFHADGDVVAYSTTISDERLKTGISTVSNALEKVSQLNGVEFTRKNNGQRSAGVIAQQVEKVLPQAIREKKLPLQTGDEDTTYKTVEYDALHSLYIEAIKELKDTVEKQALAIKELQGA
jgi:hypothetical protein